MKQRYDYAVVGGGILGLATGMALSSADPGARLIVLEKEDGWARHQSGRNSGVVHSGIYYTPGSLKARLCRAGRASLLRFCDEQGVPYDICGKLIVATREDELARLDALLDRATANGVRARKLTGEEVRELEPHAAGLAALAVPDTGRVDFSSVAHAMSRVLADGGAELRRNARVDEVIQRGDGYVLETNAGTFTAGFLINCAGLSSDRMARKEGIDPGVRIIPFRGEYHELRADRRSLVNTMIYPVPDPRFPFLGVHLTRSIDGRVHAGPSATLALKREGYRRASFSLSDAAEIVSYGGFWKLVARHGGTGARELALSWSKTLLTRSLQRLVPELGKDDLQRAGAGVRAQALYPDGRLVDDFVIREGRNSVHVCNAPSPAATASLEIGRVIADKATRR